MQQMYTEELQVRLANQFPHNEQVTCIFNFDDKQKKGPQKTKEKETLDTTRAQINDGKLKVVKHYMEFYSDLIKTVIKENNTEIYN